MLNFPLGFRPVVPMSTDARLTPSSFTNNPFRHPVSSNPTGTSSASSVSSSGSDTPEDPIARNRGSQVTSPPSTPGDNNGTPSITVDTSVASSGDPLSEELPPAYTPAPDVYSGEQSVEFGPRRPFQRAPLSPAQPQQAGAWQSPQPSGWTGYPGQMHSHQTGIPYMGSTRPGLLPPPAHPLSATRDIRPVSMPPMMPIPNVASDFARDFYTVGAGLADTSVLGGVSEQYTAQSGIVLPPPGSGTPQYDPPPSLPPRPSGSSSSHSRSQSESSSARAQPPTAGNGIPDDGSPTKSATPGHPLLNRGNILVYPKGHDCSKCHNTGYKHYDPTRPCKKCWPKYGKEYSGAITYTPWSSTGDTSSDSGKIFQKPLPKFPAARQPSHSYLTRPVVGRDTVYSRQSSSYSGASTSRVIPIAGGGVPMSPYLDPIQRSGYTQPTVPPPVGPLITSYNPPPGARVLEPGDPRIGGRLCWRCGGSGTTSFLIFDETTCSICGGVGRTFT